MEWVILVAKKKMNDPSPFECKGGIFRSPLETFIDIIGFVLSISY